MEFSIKLSTIELCEAMRVNALQEFANRLRSIEEGAVGEAKQTITPTPTPVPTAAVPTETPAFSLGQLALAGAQLCDQGKRAAVVDAIHAFGANSVQEIPQESHGAYAMKLRELGAKL